MTDDQKAIDLPVLMALAESWMLPVTPDDLAEGDFTMTENSLVASACNAIPVLLELVRVQHEALKALHACKQGHFCDGYIEADNKCRSALAKYNEMMGEGNEQ